MAQWSQATGLRDFPLTEAPISFRYSPCEFILDVVTKGPGTVQRLHVFVSFRFFDVCQFIEAVALLGCRGVRNVFLGAVVRRPFILFV
jgi:hypothetical protein